MKKRKWTFWLFETNEMGALSAYLEQMAEKGWFPDKIGEWGIVFYEDDPEKGVMRQPLFPAVPL